jgi:beta-lactamase class A
MAMAVAAAMAAGAILGATLAPPARAAAARPAGAQESPASRPACVSAEHPRLAARLSRGIAAALRGRRSVVGLTVSDGGLDLSCARDRGGHFDAASVIKVTIISALLRKVGGASHLTRHQRSLAWAMITESNNDAATDLWDQVGMNGMQRFLNLARMSHTRLNDAWGLTKITAQDELTLLRLLTSKGSVLSTASRRYVLWLMAHVVSAERWGVPAGAPADVTVHVKNGWLPYPTGSDWHINSIGAFTGRSADYQIVVLTSGNPSEDYGIDTIEDAARVINRDLARY